MTVNLGAGTIDHVVNGIVADTTRIGSPVYIVDYRRSLPSVHRLTKAQARQIAVRAQMLDAPGRPSCLRSCGS